MIDTLGKINMMLNSIGTTASLSNVAGYTDFSKMLETFTKDLFSILDNTSFGLPKNIKSNNKTVEYIAANGTEYQVTTTTNFKVKCERTIGEFIKSKKKGHRLKIIFYRILDKSEIREKNKFLNQYKKDVSILDITDISRLIANCSKEDINNIFKICYDVKPIDFDNLPIDTFMQKCKICNDYIERSFTLHENECTYKINSCEKLLEYSENILLVGDASLGKTEILKYINNYAISENRFVYRFELKHYNGKPIKEIIPKGFSLFAAPLLLLDGFDEIESQFAENFIKELNIYSQVNPNCQIIISTRANFCHKNQTSFSNFLFFTINELTDEEIQDYFYSKIGKENYLSKIELCRTLNVYDLLKNPFYLTRIANSIINDDTVSNKAELMSSILNDDYNNYKFRDVKSYGEIIKNLKNFALYLFNTDKTASKLNEYLQLDNDQMKSFPWLLFEDDNVSFVHNNFKEYLIALCLNDYPLSKIKKIISVKIDKVFIKPQYCNILSFLLAMTKDNKLHDYVLKYGKNIILEIEPTSLSDNEKYYIVKEIYSEYEQKKSWPDAYLYNTNKLAQICNTKKIIEFLIKYVNYQSHRTIIIFTLEILREVTCLYGYRNYLKNYIINWLNDDNLCIDESITSSLIYFLNKLNIDKEEIKSLYLKYRKHPRSRVRTSVNYLIKENRLTSEFLNELVEGLDYGWSNVYKQGEKKDDIIDASENYNIVKAISELDDEPSILYLLDYVIENERKYESKFVTKYVFEAVKKIPILSKEIEIRIYQLLKLLSTHCATHLRSFIVDLSKNKKLNFKLISRILQDKELNNYQKNYLISIIFTEEGLEICIKYFKTQDLSVSNEFITILKTNYSEWELIKKSFHRSGLKCVLLENSYDLEQSKLLKKNFNNLFDIEKIKELVGSVFSSLNKDKLTRREIRDYYIYNNDKKIPMYLYSLFDYDCKTSTSKKDVYKRITTNWQIQHIYEILHNNKELEVDKKQLLFIESWVRDQMTKINFESAITYEEDSWKTSYNAIYCDYFIKELDIYVEKEIYRQMLCFSWGASSDNDFTQLEYLEEKLGKDDFIMYLSEYCNRGLIKGYLLGNAIKYCISKKYNILSNCITDKLSKITPSTDSYNNTIFLDYLKIFNRLNDALEFYNNFPLSLKIHLIHLCFEVRNVQIIPYAINDIKKDDKDSIKIAKELLCFADLNALKYYINWVKKNKSFSIINEYPYSNLKAYVNKKHLKILLELLELTYQFKDEENRILSDIMYCIEKICLSSKITEVRKIIRRLNQYIKRSKHENVNYLHFYLDGIKFNYIQQ